MFLSLPNTHNMTRLNLYFVESSGSKWIKSFYSFYIFNSLFPLYDYWAHMLQLPKPGHPRAHALQQDKPPQSEAHVL